MAAGVHFARPTSPPPHGTGLVLSPNSARLAGRRGRQGRGLLERPESSLCHDPARPLAPALLCPPRIAWVGQGGPRWMGVA